MTQYEHRKLAETIRALDRAPEDDPAFEEWIAAGSHLEFLRKNALDPRVVVYASGEYSFIHAVAVPESNLESADPHDLLNWSFNPFTSVASYVTGGGRDDVWVERRRPWTGTAALAGATLLVYGRAFEGWSGPGESYFELNQEFAHLAEIHWRPERKAYCRFDHNGDFHRKRQGVRARFTVQHQSSVVLPLAIRLGSWKSSIGRSSREAWPGPP